MKGSSGVFSIVMKPGAEARLDAALTGLRIFAIGASWGGTRSLIAPMAVSGERTVNAWNHPGTVLRISIGLEEPGDLWADLETMLATLGGTAADKAA